MFDQYGPELVKTADRNQARRARTEDWTAGATIWFMHCPRPGPIGETAVMRPNNEKGQRNDGDNERRFKGSLHASEMVSVFRLVTGPPTEVWAARHPLRLEATTRRDAAYRCF